MLQTGRWRPWLFVGPALLLITFFLVYPTIMTIARSFFGRGTTLFGPMVEYVGVANWRYVFTNQVMLTALRNNALWAVLFTTCTVGFGLALAVLLDRVKYEKIAKSVKDTGVADKISHRKLILSGHVAVLSGECEEELPGWEIMVGPREAVNLPQYLKMMA